MSTLAAQNKGPFKELQHIAGNYHTRAIVAMVMTVVLQLLMLTQGTIESLAMNPRILCVSNRNYLIALIYMVHATM